MLEDIPVPEAKLERTEHGAVPASDGWFILNVADARATRSENFDVTCMFEGEGAAAFPEFGINVSQLQPGKPNCFYHRENAQEDFLVLSGECIALVEGEERPMRAGDLLHAPPNTAHVLVGAGDGPCIVVMAGTRMGDDEDLLYPVSEVAKRHGASAAEATGDPEVAYAACAPREPAEPFALPWE